MSCNAKAKNAILKKTADRDLKNQLDTLINTNN